MVWGCRVPFWGFYRVLCGLGVGFLLGVLWGCFGFCRGFIWFVGVGFFVGFYTVLNCLGCRV